MANNYGLSFDIPSLRRKSLFDGYGGQEDNPYEGLFDPSGQQDQEDPYGGLFRGHMPPPTTTESVSPQRGNFDDIFRLIDEKYHPEHAATDKFNQLLDKYPERERPSLGRTLVASAAGFAGGPKAAYEIMDRPHNLDMEDWKNQTTPRFQAATNERTANANERQLLGNLITSKTASDRQLSADEKYRAEILSREKIAGDKNEIARIRAKAYEYDKMLGKGWDWDLKGPTAKKFNKTTGEIVETGIDTGKMDEETKIELQNKGKLEAAQALGANATDLEAARQSGRPFTIDGKQYVIVDGKAVPIQGAPEGIMTRPGTPGQSGTKPNPLNDDRERQVRLRTIFEENNEIAKKWITPGVGGKYILKPRPTLKEGSFFSKGVTQQDLDEWDAVKAEVDPGSTRKPATSTSSNTQPKPKFDPVQLTPGQMGTGKSTNTGQYSPQEIQTMSPEEKRQRAIGFLIANNLPAVEANIQHAIKTGRFQRDSR